MPLELSKTSAEVLDGAGGLKTIRIVYDLSAVVSATASPKRVEFRNGNYADRTGWREMVVKRSSGIEVFDTTGYGSGVSDELRAYPQDSISAPLNEREVSFSYSTGSVPTGSAGLINRDGHSSRAGAKR